MNAEPIALSTAADQIVCAHCERMGLTLDAALDDLIHRGAAQLVVRDLRDTAEHIRATVDDTYQALDALAPYAIAALSLMAHWATHSGTTKLGEVDYAEAARDTGRATWDGHLASRGLLLPMRPAADQPAADQPAPRPPE